MNTTDRTLLRELAARQMELANSPKNLERVALWKRLGSFQPTRPLVVIELDTFAQEVIPPLLKCQTPEARAIEETFYKTMVNLTLFDDDKVIPPYFSVSMQSRFIPFGLDVKTTHAQGSLGHHFVQQITDLEEDFHKLGKSIMEFDAAASKARVEQLSELFGDILPVRETMACLYSVPTQNIVHIMDMETMLYSLYDYPDLFKKMMDNLANDYIEYFHQLQDRGMLRATTSFEGVGNGTVAFTDELPQEPKTTKDVWGFLDSQETVSISPEMFGEFIFPYYKRIADEYGLLSYGCCEPVHPFWDYLSTMENLRKVSISAWCDEEFMGEALRGRRTVYHRKPEATMLGVQGALDEDYVRMNMRKTVQAAKDCPLEITQRDVYTIGGDVSKVKRYVEIIREETDR